MRAAHLALLSLAMAATVLPAAADYSDFVSEIEEVKENVIASSAPAPAPPPPPVVTPPPPPVVTPPPPLVVTKVIDCWTGLGKPGNSLVGCIFTNVSFTPASNVTINLLTVQAVCPTGFEALGGQCAFVPSTTTIPGTSTQIIATGAFAQGLSTPLRNPAALGGDPAPTGLVTTQFCTGLQNPTAASPELNAIGARAYCSPIKL